MTDHENHLIKDCTTGIWDGNILGHIGIRWSDGTIDLLCWPFDGSCRLRLPPPTGEIIRDIEARKAARAA